MNHIRTLSCALALAVSAGTSSAQSFTDDFESYAPASSPRVAGSMLPSASRGT